MKTIALASVIALAGCASPLGERRARVMLPGELEVGATGVLTTAVPLPPPGKPPVMLSAPVEGSARFGVIERVDVQLRTGATVWPGTPEASVGVQLFGDPHDPHDVAVTVTGGAQAFLGYGGPASSVLFFPAQVIVDVPLFFDAGTFTIGARAVPRVDNFPDAQRCDTMVFAGGFAALDLDLGRVFLRPEVGVNTLIAPDATSRFRANGTTVAVGIGVGHTFDFR